MTLSCDEIQNRLSDYMDPQDPSVVRDEIAQHLETCDACERHHQELEALVALLRSRKAPAAPDDLAARIHARLAAEPVPLRPAGGFWASFAHRINWPSMAAGAVAAGLIMMVAVRLYWVTSPIPSIQTAAVDVARPASVNIGFDVDRDVEDVTFTIDLPKGLQFVDANNQPLEAQTISWQGSLRRGKTVVPITVRGVQPGRYEIMATVRKNQFARSTRIVLPVDGRSSHRDVAIAHLSGNEAFHVV